MQKVCSSFSGACIPTRNIRGAASGSPSARRLSNSMAAGSGTNPSLVMDAPSNSHCRRGRTNGPMKTPEILMVDDNPADIDLTSEVLAQSEQYFHVNAVNDGVEAISFLRRQGKYAQAPLPDLVVLDLN